jgi:hypothetical protein
VLSARQQGGREKLMKKVILISVSLLVGASIAFYLITYFVVRSKLTASDDISNDLKFEAKIWAKGTMRQRGQMINYLLDSIGLVDKTKEEIKNLLGDPDAEYNIDDGEYKSTFHYSVDKGHTFTYDMVIAFNSTDHVKFILFDD